MRLVLLSIMLQAVALFSHAQSKHPNYWDEKLPLTDTSYNEIDPRKYVRVLYKKNPNYRSDDGLEVQRVVWNWNDSGYFQKFKVLDNEGFLNIYFKKDELAQNYNFQGNISLEAFLKGKDGERKIEVGPYSLVGVDRKEIGIQSFPATAVAQFLFNMLSEMKRTIVSIDLTPYDTTLNFMDDYIELQNILKNINDVHKTTLKTQIDTSENSFRIVRYYTYDTSFYKPLLKYNGPIGKLTYADLARDLEAVLKDFKNFFIKRGRDFRKDLVFLQSRVTLINNYLSSFEKAGPDAVKAFLDLASKDKINFGFIKKQLAADTEALADVISNVDYIKNTDMLFSSRENLDLANRILDNFETLSSSEGSAMEILVKKFIPDSTVMAGASEIRNELEEQNDRPIPYWKFSDNFLKKSNQSFIANKYSRYIRYRLMEKSDSLEEFKRKLSIQAAEIIYRKLVFASVDLGKSGAQPGDILYLNVVWKNIDGDGDTTSKSASSLPIGKYYLRQTGWRTEISESFYLVERISEPANDPNLSKSNFKGAYGASIMRTFYYNENFERTRGGRILNWAQPSFGFNISYLDFYTNKDIEIGAGLQLGLFKNVFYFGTGLNLHSIRGDEKKSAAYFMFGVSFTNIAAKFKNNDKSGE